MKVAIGSVALLTAVSTCAIAQEHVPDKHMIGQAPTQACQAIAASRGLFQTQKITRVTQYFIPLFSPDESGALRPEDRRACLKMEGSCVVGEYLYNAGAVKPYVLKNVAFKFGLGSGKGPFNRTGALDPCRTIAADRSVYPIGTALYIPAMAGRVCPQSLKPIDGCFVVGDVGSAIKGAGRFDVFTGECARYDKVRSICEDKANAALLVDRGEPFIVIPRDHPSAQALRSEADAFVDDDWGR